MRTTLVVPCFNEAARFDAAAFDRALASDTQLDVVLVDDGSTDGTRVMLQALAERHPARVAVLALDRNAGKAEAVRQGLRSVLSRPGHYLGYWDADLATPLDASRELAACLDRDPTLDGVLGSRVLLLGRRIERHASRHYAGRVFATAASLALGLAVYDTQCGAKLFRPTAALAAALEHPFRTRWAFDVELIARLYGVGHAAARCALCEYPLREWRDVPGSKVSLAGALRAMLDLGRIAWHYRRTRTTAAAARDGRWTPLPPRATSERHS